MATSIVFIDARVETYEALLKGIDPSAEVYLLDGLSDGLTQIATRLQGCTDVDALHIISHGSQGALYLGSTTLDHDNLSDYALQLSAIGSTLTASGDILLYGCNVAAGSAGLDFIGPIARLTGGDVAASTDATGSSILNGNWILEAHTGGHICPVVF